jgi:hypothetical protein
MPPKKTQQKASQEVKGPALKLRPVRSTVDYTIPGYVCLNDENPAVDHLYPKKKQTLAEPYTIRAVDVSAQLLHVAECTEPIPIYMKVVHLLDPQSFMKTHEGYVETPSAGFWNFGHGMLRFHHNKAYTEAIAYNYASTIADVFGVPHYVKWLGSVRAFADTYTYDMDADFDTYRFRGWFWKNYDAGWYDLRIQERDTGRVLDREEVANLFRPDDDILTDTSTLDSDSDSDSDDDLGEDMGNDLGEDMDIVDLEVENITPISDSIAAFEAIDTFSVASSASELPTPRRNVDGHSHKAYSENDDSDSYTTESLTEKYNCYAILRQMPVYISFLEKQDGILDVELETCGDPSAERDSKWLAWIFQVVAALANLQDHIGLTHNDLHTNNVLWKSTTEPYMYYKSKTSGKHYRVPTFGKVMRVIDFGRSIYQAERKSIMISSDYYDGNDAAGMYNFGPIMCEGEARRMPNRAFDLSLFSCSILRSLFYVSPAEKEGAPILSNGPSEMDTPWIVRATESPLFNLLWSWVVGRDKTSLYETEEGYERWEGFGLYIGLAEHAVAGVPAEQFGKEWVKMFESVEIPMGTRVIPIP